MGEEQPDANQPPPRRRVTVQEAAEVLSVTVEAVRGRIKRGKLEAERDKDGSVYVWIDADQSTTSQDQPETGPDQPTTSQRPDERLDNQEQLVESLLEQVAYMREQLAAEREANRENRRLLAAALERIPAIESPETPQSPETPSEEPAGTSAGTSAGERETESSRPEERRSWWRRMLGLE